MKTLSEDIKKVLAEWDNLNKQSKKYLFAWCLTSVYLLFFIIIATLLITAGFKHYIISERVTYAIAIFLMAINTYLAFKLGAILKEIFIPQEKRLPANTARIKITINKGGCNGA